MMVGRLDDWMKVLVERDDIALDPDAANWAGIAVFKRAYGIYQERGYRTRLLAAAYRHRLHWTELVGGDVVLTMPHAWQVRFNESGIDPEPRIDVPVDPAIVDDLLRRIPDFGRAYEPDGLAIDEFDVVRRDRPDPARLRRVVPRPAGHRSATSSCPTPTSAPADPGADRAPRGGPDRRAARTARGGAARRRRGHRP